MNRHLAWAFFVPIATAFAQDLPVKHTVKPNDTLWDLASQYYHDPYKWPIISQANPAPTVKDPHWIYPNQILIIPSLETNPNALPEEQPEQPAVTEPTEPAQTPVKPVERPVEPPPKRSQAFQGDSGGEGISENFPKGMSGQYPFSGRFKAKKGWKADGTVLIDSRDGERMAALGDVVRVRVNSRSKPVDGDEFSVFRRSGALDTEDEQDALYLVRIGRIRIHGNSGKSVNSGLQREFEATVLKMQDAVQYGDLLVKER